MNKFRVLLMGAVLALGGFLVAPSPAHADVDHPVSVEHVATHVGTEIGVRFQMPMHNETALSLFSCAATRPSGFGSANVLHSHRIAASSTVDIFGQPEIDAFDCEVQNGGGGGPEAIYRTIYVYGNVDDGTNGGSTDKGIIGPLNVTRF